MNVSIDFNAKDFAASVNTLPQEIFKITTKAKRKAIKSTARIIYSDLTGKTGFTRKSLRNIRVFERKQSIYIGYKPTNIGLMKPLERKKGVRIRGTFFPNAFLLGHGEKIKTVFIPSKFNDTLPAGFFARDAKFKKGGISKIYTDILARNVTQNFTKYAQVLTNATSTTIDEMMKNI